jgi:purine-binding chemotaxis protein CheW
MIGVMGENDTKKERKTNLEREKTKMAETQQTGQLSDVAVAMHKQAGKYFTFVLDKEEYGIEILKVREIIGIIDITPVPRVSHYIKGVINLRGKVIPVIDLRLKFGMQEIEYTEQTCIIVLDVADKLMGVVVDTVSEVLDIAGEQIEPVPDFGASLDTDYILGMGKIDDAVKILLDIDKVLSDGNLNLE